MCEHYVARASEPFRLDELWSFTDRLERYGIASTGIYSIDRSVFRFVAPGAKQRRLVRIGATVTLDRNGEVAQAS